ncbi:hypothetical protein [Streptomyces sp. NPDC016172]|uniref:hypothetical protein n=1 Tax=Streptomyces sp. NPDC016172 TaxID=3364964 RepID=UPI003702469C
MTDPAPKSPCSSPCPVALEPAELISDGTCCTCLRYNRAILALLVANLLVALVFGVLGVVRDDSSAKPGPKPSPTATATPSPSEPAPSELDPSSPPTHDPTPTAAPTGPEPTGSPCNIFDPECPGSTGGSTTGGAEG